MISPEDMRARWWLVPALYVVAPWLWLAVRQATAPLSLSGEALAYLALGTVACGITGSLHASALRRAQTFPPLVFSLLLGLLAPMAIVGVMALILAPTSVVLGVPALEPELLLSLPMIAILELVLEPIHYAAIVLWFGVGAWLLLRPELRLARPATGP